MAGLLVDSVAVVAGSMHGLGQAFAVALAYQSARVALVAPSPGEAEDAAQKIRRAGGDAHAFTVGLHDHDETRAAVVRIQEELGPIDLLVNNAGMATPVGPLVDTDPAEWWHAQEINLRAPMMWTHSVLPAMIERRHGRIINVAAGAGTSAVPFMSAYLTSKTALIRFTEVLAQEVKSSGVRAFAIEPGTMRAAMAMYALESPVGRRWIPWYRNIFDAQEDAQPEYAAELIVRIARGDADRLTGRFISRDDDLDLILRQAERAIENEWGVLRVRGH